MKWFPILTLLLSLSASADSGIQKPVSFSEFIRQTNAYWLELRYERSPEDSVQNPEKIQAGYHGFLGLEYLLFGQDRISIDNIFYKNSEMIDAGSKRYDNGRSLVPLNDAIQVVKGPQGFVITDGNHDFFLSLFHRMRTLPVVVKADYSDLSPQDFWRKMTQEGHVLFSSTPFHQLIKNGPQIGRVVDQPNRFLAALIALKASVEWKGGTAVIKAVKGSNTPVWVKINDGFSFMEFFIADALSASRIEYNPEWGTHIPKEIEEASRVALLEEETQRRFKKLKGVIVISDRKSSKQLREDTEALSDFIRSLGPKKLLRATGQARSCQAVFRF